MRGVVVPVKSFARAKFRLAGVLDARQREQLARSLAAHVVDAAKGAAVFVVCDDGDVADWAIAREAMALYAPGLGLSAAVEAGVDYLFAHGFSLAVVAHGDLPLADDLARFGAEGAVTLAPDRRHDGTNVAAVPTGAGFRFSYGQGSFERHRQEATRLGLDCRVVEDRRLATDVDLPSDLGELERDRLPLLTSLGALDDDAPH